MTDKSNMRNIFFRMNCHTLKYNIFFPQLLVIILSFILATACNLIDKYIEKNVYNSIENRTFFAIVKNDTDESFKNSINSAGSIVTVGSDDNIITYQIVMSDFSDVNELIAKLTANDNVLSCTRQKDTNLDDSKNPLIVFYKVNRYLYFAFIIGAFIILAILANKEYHAENTSRFYLNVFSYSRKYTIRLHIYIMFIDLIFFSVIFVFFGIVLYTLSNKSDILYLLSSILFLPFAFIYSKTIFCSKNNNVKL